MFIGNSMTGDFTVPGEAIPLILQSLAANTDHPVFLGREHAWNAFVIYGVGLDYHLLYDGAARDALDPDINPTDIWDYVVLQDYSSQWREQPDAFFYGVSNWDARIKTWGAQRNPNVATVLWENWTWLDRPDDIANLVAAYATMAGPPPQGVNAILVPNGRHGPGTALKRPAPRFGWITRIRRTRVSTSPRASSMPPCSGRLRADCRR